MDLKQGRAQDMLLPGYIWVLCDGIDALNRNFSLVNWKKVRIFGYCDVCIWWEGTPTLLGTFRRIF